MAWRLSGNRAAALVAGIGYSLISPACLLVKEVRFDAGGWFAGRRLNTLIVYGEGPHLTAHVPSPAGHRPAPRGAHQTAALVLRAGGSRNRGRAVEQLAGRDGAGLLASRPTCSSGFHTRWPSAWLRTAGLGICAYALALPWMSPAVIAVIRANAPRVANNFESDTLQRIYLAAAAAAFLLARLGHGALPTARRPRALRC